MLTGSHNTPFMYTHTVDPADAAVWTRPVPVLSSGYLKPGERGDGRGRQAYVSLVCTPDDTLVLAFRQWRQGVDRVFGGRGYQALCVQTLEPGGAWSAAQRLAYSSRHPGYAQYYQKLSVDRLGRLFLSLSYFRPHDWPRNARSANRYRQRMVLISVDGGRGWRFATPADYREGVVTP